MRGLSIIAVTFVLLNSVLAPASSGSGHDSHKSSKKGANMDLFAPPKPDLSKSARPGRPDLLEPSYRAQIQEDSTLLKWSDVPTADAYHLQVATDPNFKWLIVNEQSLKATSYEVKGLMKSNHYFWRVAAIKLDNVSNFMKGWFSLSLFEKI